MTATELRTALVASGVLSPGYEFPLTWERTRGLRLSFLRRIWQTSAPARYEHAARLCDEYIAMMEEAFSRRPEKIRTHWLKEIQWSGAATYHNIKDVGL